MSRNLRRPVAPRLARPVLRIAALAVLVLVATALVGCGPAVPDGATDFQLETLDGRTLGPGDFPGKVVVVDFWATWCGPCRLQAAELEEVHGRWSEDQVQFLAVDIGESRELVERHVAENPFPYPVLLDPDDTLSLRLNLMALPTVMVVGQEGEILYFDAGVLFAEELEKILQDALG